MPRTLEGSCRCGAVRFTVKTHTRDTPLPEPPERVHLMLDYRPSWIPFAPNFPPAATNANRPDRGNAIGAPATSTNRPLADILPWPCGAISRLPRRRRSARRTT